MMNSVPAGVSGTVAEVSPRTRSWSSTGEPLFRVEPA